MSGGIAPARRATLAAIAAAASVAALQPPPDALTTLLAPPAAQAAPSAKLPPIDTSDPNRCRASSSAIGQANAVRDKPLDLRLCDLRGGKFSGYDMSGALLEGVNLEGAHFKDAKLSKAYARNVNFRGADFTDAVLDRATFDGSDLTGAVLANALLSDASFDEASVLRDTDFSDVYIGDFAQRRLCKNPTLDGENPVTGVPTRGSLGCR